MLDSCCFNSVDFVLSGYNELLTIPCSELDNVGKCIAIPQFPKDVVMKLCENAEMHFQSQPMVLKVPSETRVVGDIHGSFHDLLRILITDGHPLSYNYLFLGDYVDRGPLSLECIILLLALLVNNPNQIYMIRGNHEFKEVASQYGFKKEITDLYEDEDVFDAFMNAFSMMPLAAVIDNKFFCVHGGLSPNLRNIEQIERLERPIDDFSDTLVTDMVWSDPNPNYAAFQESNRGSGILYGVVATKDFLSKNNLLCILRGHECVNGTHKDLENTVLTVFSSSNYKVGCYNSCGIAEITAEDNSPRPIRFPPFDKPKRISVLFYTMARSRPLVHPKLCIISFSRQSSKINMINKRRSSISFFKSSGDLLSLNSSNPNNIYP